VIASQAISGDIQITSYTGFGTRFLASGVLNDGWEASGTFVITSSAADSTVPEPSSGTLLCAGAFLVALLTLTTHNGEGARQMTPHFLRIQRSTGVEYVNLSCARKIVLKEGMGALVVRCGRFPRRARPPDGTHSNFGGSEFDFLGKSPPVCLTLSGYARPATNTRTRSSRA
jgi:hypothetical protein